MVASWLRNRRRRILTAEPLPPAWRERLEESVRHYRHLPVEARRRVDAVVQVVVAEKQWVGYDCDVTDAMRVVIAGNAALLSIGFQRPYFFDRLDTIVIHRSAIVRTAEQAAVHPWLGEPGVHAGESWQQGPVVLSWSTIQREAAGRLPGRNVVLHEFAHHLDGLHGEMDGTPPLEADAAANWRAVAESEYLRLVGAAQRDEATVLDHYGAESPSEFFAVATECFFELPHALRRWRRELYVALESFYRQDPTVWLPESSADRTSLRQVRRGDSSGEMEEQGQADRERLKAYRTMNTPDALFTLALEHLYSERFEDATRVLTSLIENDPFDSEALAHRAVARYQLGKPMEALADCDAALSLDPDDVDAICVRAEVLFDQGAHDQSLEEINTAVAIAPKDAEVRLRRGRLHSRLGNWQRAVADLDESVFLNPFCAEAFWRRGMALDALGHSGAAQRDLKRARLIDPEIESVDRP